MVVAERWEILPQALEGLVKTRGAESILSLDFSFSIPVKEIKSVCHHIKNHGLTLETGR